MSEPTTAPDWNALAEALEACHGGYNDEGVPSLVGEGVANVWRAARWALEHGPALEAAVFTELEVRYVSLLDRYVLVLPEDYPKGPKWIDGTSIEPGDLITVQIQPPTGEAQ